MKKTMIFLLAILISGMTVVSTSFAADVVIVVNKNNDVSILSSADLKKIYLGKTSRWENGTKIRLYSQGVGEVNTSFISDYIKKSPAQFYNYWKKQLFTGKASPPMELKGDQQVIKFVAADRNAIGYISRTAMTDEVKEVTIN